MVNVRLKVRALLARDAVEFERDLCLEREPFVGQALPLGRGGEDGPLFVDSVLWSTVFKAFVCRAEDDVAEAEVTHRHAEEAAGSTRCITPNAA